MHHRCHSDQFDLPHSPASSISSFDEDEVNQRVTPNWSSYRTLFRNRGFRLDTVRDVKEYYHRYVQKASPDPIYPEQFPGFLRACQYNNDDDLCPDAGLPNNLFRGKSIKDGGSIMFKGVHLHSREYEIIRLLSNSPYRDDTMNHMIPILDLIDVPRDQLGFIVMEEWSPQFITDSGPHNLILFLASIRQCIEHIVFLHRHHIAHLDISLHNILTDSHGRYAYIDYQMSRRFDGTSRALIHGYRGTEIPPECGKDEVIDPYKIDVWALAVLILRACQRSGHYVPEIMPILRPMLLENPEYRPSLPAVLQAFNRVTVSMGEGRMAMISTTLTQ